MTITSLRYQPIEGGTLGGHFALHVSFGEDGLPGATFSATTLATKIHDIFESLDPKHKVKGVLLDCREAVGSNDEMISLLQTLKDWGYVRVLWVGESTRYSWLDPSQYIVAFVTSQHWPNFRVNEIRYVMPKDKAAWVEPDVYDVNGGAYCYVVPQLAASGEVVAFLVNCKRPWGVVRGNFAVSYTL
jgi:hypothetical protein